MNTEKNAASNIGEQKQLTKAVETTAVAIGATETGRTNIGGKSRL